MHGQKGSGKAAGKSNFYEVPATGPLAGIALPAATYSTFSWQQATTTAGASSSSSSGQNAPGPSSSQGAVPPATRQLLAFITRHTETVTVAVGGSASTDDVPSAEHVVTDMGIEEQFIGTPRRPERMEVEEFMSPQQGEAEEDDEEEEAEMQHPYANGEPEHEEDLQSARADTSVGQLMSAIGRGSAGSASASNLFMPWTQHAWHARTRLSNGREGLLVDVGAHDNLMGSRWADRVMQAHQRAGTGRQAETWTLTSPISVEGVGNGAMECRTARRIPLSLPGGSSATFDAPVIPDSDVPALLGLKSLRRHRALIDVAGAVMHSMGPGDYQVIAPPGSQPFALETSPSGHLMLPVTENLGNRATSRDVGEDAGAGQLALHYQYE
jgi:hypothetical protein